jgi:hypothetical protein
MQLVIEQILDDGYARIDDTSVVYSHLFFDGLRILMLGMTRLEDTNESRIQFERASVAQRIKRLRGATALVRGWPEEFLKFCDDIRHPCAAFSQDTAEIPFWLWSVLRSQPFRVHAVMTEIEFNTIIKAAVPSNLSASQATVRRLLWRNLSRKRLKKRYVEDKIVDALVASIEREIKTAKGRARMTLLRDKVMIVVGRSLRLSIVQLLQFRTQNLTIPALVAVLVEDRPAQVVQAIAMLKWYAQSVRPQFSGGRATSLFTTYSGQALSASAVGERFRRAVRVAGLSHAIPTWAHWIGVNP